MLTNPATAATSRQSWQPVNAATDVAHLHWAAHLLVVNLQFCSHANALHCTALHCTALHCTALHCTALHCTALHCMARHDMAYHCIVLHCTALHCIALHVLTDVRAMTLSWRLTQALPLRSKWSRVNTRWSTRTQRRTSTWTVT